jgi:hypothetical protein
MKRRARSITVIAALAFTPAHAEQLTYKEQTVSQVLSDYYSDSNAKRMTESMMVLDTYNGISWTNSYMSARFHKPIFCPPKKIVFTVDQLIDIVRRGAEGDRALAELPFAMALVEMMVKTFPCQGISN